MKVFNEIVNFFRYLSGKRTEVKSLSVNDVVLGKVILDIHRKKSATVFTLVPLYSVKPVHPINRENSLGQTEKRAEILLHNKKFLLQEKNITRKILAEYLPSVSWIKVVKINDTDYVSYEGNGRIAALCKVFTPDDNMFVEVEEYQFKKPAKIIRRLNRVRTMNGLLT